MAIKKSDLYSSLWASCDELRGGMDASQYKDYVLVLLFIKYISDKYNGIPFAPITIPSGASFSDMVALKGTPNIGDDINKKIIGPLARANKLSDMPDFNDVTKLGSGKEMVDRLTNLIAIFENKALDFSKNRAEGDDILGDAYEYLMRHFATESGKSKGQFYTPAEVSRIMAQIIGINPDNTTVATTVYDPTCGSGSLLLRVAEAVGKELSLYGQEKDSATAGLARMNMILHNNTIAVIEQGNTLANPRFTEDENTLTTFDYVVANPPFSDKSWSNGVKIANGSDQFDRFTACGVPPAKNGDYAYLLHIVRSLKREGKGACILPHGVLFRGNAEAEIRKKLVKRGWIKGIIGLPPNLFYGTGIPACIMVIDKENATERSGIFMIDASRGYIKDGNKNRLRSRDIHLIVDTFNQQKKVDKYARLVSYEEIKQNEYNLNLPRYIDSQEVEDVQDIEAHLLGGIPQRDIDALQPYWEVCPGLRAELFSDCGRENYRCLTVDKNVVKQIVFEHPEFKAFRDDMNRHFVRWKTAAMAQLMELQPGFAPKALIVSLSENLLAHYGGRPLLDAYNVYQHLMDYWETVMQDDCYQIAADGWKAEPYRIIQVNKQGKEVDKGWACDLVPKELIVNRFFQQEKEYIETMETQADKLSGKISELEEEHGGDEGYFNCIDKVNKSSVQARMKEIKRDQDAVEERQVLEEYLELVAKLTDVNSQIKEAVTALDAQSYAQYQILTAEEIKTLVVADKWLSVLENEVYSEMEHISQGLAKRIREIAERYETPLPDQQQRVNVLEAKVKGHLEKMGFAW